MKEVENMSNPNKQKVPKGVKGMKVIKTPREKERIV